MNMQNCPAGTWYERRPDGFTVGTSHRSGSSYAMIPFMLVWMALAYRGVRNSLDVWTSLAWMAMSAVVVISGLLALFGQTFLRKKGDSFEAFTGIGPVGWTRCAQWSGFTSTKIKDAGESKKIIIEGSRRLSFGRGIPAARRDFIAEVLRQELTASK